MNIMLLASVHAYGLLTTSPSELTLQGPNSWKAPIMLELPGPPLILEGFSMSQRAQKRLARYQDVKGAFVGSPFLVSKNQN